ncbi:MAG: GNAT family N-acetyltransferase [Alphaproteobacteria bacterium]|nr:GNAT family N-acetyltransferase [Alphaproteobacteria bacterium]
MDALNPFRITWNRHSRTQWDGMLDACKRPSLTQTSTYALALHDVHGQKADFGLIRFRDQPIGMVVAHGKPVFGRAGSQTIYRGPAWIHDEIPGEMQKLALGLLRKRYRLRNGRPVTFHPELADTREHRSQLAAAGFKRVAEGYRTIWVDLGRSRDELRADMHQNWRNALVQGERSDLAVVEDTDGTRIDWLAERHGAHMEVGGYRGASRDLITALHCHANDTSGLRLLVAEHAGEPVAGILLATHGAAATYLVGWTGERGRDLRATHVLLWHAVGLLQDAGKAWFDLGGISDEAPGVMRFKRGLGGAETTLVGGYV